MAVYNVEPYIREAVDSVIAQDFGLENIQLILVDDRSTDDSGKICDEYAARYPQNTVVIHKENGGQSSARNRGVAVAEGEFINFIDPDDYLDNNICSAVYEFVMDEGKDVDVVAFPIELFGTQSGGHSLNYKFSQGTRVIDLEKEWQMVQLSLSAAFIRTNAAKEFAFKEDLSLACGEDAREVMKLLLHNSQLGVVTEGVYHYRKRDDSTLGGITEKKNWYSDYLDDFACWIIKYCMEQKGYVPRFIQHAILYDLQWKFRQSEIPEGVLTEEEQEAYKDKLYGLIPYFDDIVIQRQKYIGFHIKSFLYYKKHGGYPRQILMSGDAFHLYGDCAAFPISKYAVYVSFARIAGDCLVLEGRIPHYVCADKTQPAFYACVNGERIEAKYTGYSKPVYVIGDLVCFERGFRMEIPLITDCMVRFYRETVFGEVQAINIQREKYCPISTMDKSYFAKDGWILTYKKATFYLKRGKAGFWNYEMPFLRQLYKTNREGGRKAILVRLLYRLMKPFYRKRDIWLIADKANRADDNGEAFFKYMCHHKPENVKPIFLVEKGSEDFDRLKQYGTVVPYMSWHHKFLYLHAKYVISAYSHDEINNPFLGHHDPYRDLLQGCKYIFLQHGIIKDDLSKGTNKFHKNMVGFITSVHPEYRSIVDHIDVYGYEPDEVWLTGLPRYDYLYHDEKNSIVIMPTWRRALFGDYHAEHSQWDLKPGFKESDYFIFYNSLLNHEKLLSVADQLGYKIVFVPHPVLFPYIDQFSVDARVEVKGTDVVYRDMFAQSKLLLTDFSSVAFDFAYLRKPVVYAHFDTNHYDEGYFNYERDGMGEVEYDLEATVERLIEYMRNGCQLKEQYRERIDRFFAFNDQNNCERVYQKIMELEAHSEL